MSRRPCHPLRKWDPLKERDYEKKKRRSMMEGQLLRLV